MPDPSGVRPPLVAIKSAHDIGSAVAHRLKREGYAPVLLELPTPGATRRLMSFAGAVRGGEAELEGLRAVRCGSAERVVSMAGGSGVIPLWVAPWEAPLPWPVAVVVDARMRKKEEPPVQIGEAPLVIGIGPGFVAGVHVHAVIESNWGEALGRVIREGGSQPYTGQHREVSGLGAERYVYAPAAGVFRTGRELLERVRPGDEVGTLGAEVLRARAGGILRGLADSGLKVEAGAKLVEVDPTGDPENCRGLADRPARIAEGVLEAIRKVAPA